MTLPTLECLISRCVLWRARHWRKTLLFRHFRWRLGKTLRPQHRQELSPLCAGSCAGGRGHLAGPYKRARGAQFRTTWAPVHIGSSAVTRIDRNNWAHLTWLPEFWNSTCSFIWQLDRTSSHSSGQYRHRNGSCCHRNSGACHHTNYDSCHQRNWYEN